MDDPQILLQELVEAVKNLEGLVEAVNRPDWWAIGITAVNAVIIIGLTLWQLCLNKRQTQIQERQNELHQQQIRLQERQNEYQEIQTKLMDLQVKSQEYGVYRPLYEIIHDTNWMAEHLLTRIYEYFAFPIYRALDKKFLISLYKELTTLNQRFDATKIDFSLKFSHELPDVEKYSSLIADMRMIVQQFIYMEQDNYVEYLEERSTSAAIIAHRGDVSVLIDAIIRRITSEQHKKPMTGMITRFLSKQESVLGHHTLEKIAERCKID